MVEKAVVLRDLTALQTYSFEEFESSKSVFAKTAEQCVEHEAKIAELDNVIVDLRENKALYKDDRRVDRIVNRLQCTRNFLYKQVSKFTAFETVLNEKRELLEKKRAENLKLLEESKGAKVQAAKDFDEKRNAPIKSRLETKSRGNPNFAKGKRNPYVKGGKNGK